MIVFLYGKDSYRLKQNLDKIVDEYAKKYSGLSYAVLDVEEKDKMSLLEDAVKTVSFFNEKRLLVVKNSFAEADKISGLITSWELGTDKQRIVVFAENSSKEELNKRNKDFFEVLTGKPNMIKNFEPLSGKQLENWVAKEVANLDSNIEAEALKKLLTITGPDTWRLGQEINKLANFCGGGLIKQEHVELLVHNDEAQNIFQVIDAVAGRNKHKAEALLYDQLGAGEDPYYIFSMITYQFRNLLRVKSLIKDAVPYAGIIKKTGLNPFVVKKTFEQSKKYDLDELKKMFAQLAGLDVTVKNGGTDMTEGLYQFVFSL